MIAAIEDRIDELEGAEFDEDDYFESYKPMRESSVQSVRDFLHDPGHSRWVDDEYTIWIVETPYGKRYFNTEKDHDRWFMFMDAGSGISIKKPVQEIAVGKIGGGYRLALSRTTGLAFLMSARMTYTHPEIIYDKQPVSIDKINRCNAFLTAISLGISLSF
jgi:hypothetical protein